MKKVFQTVVDSGKGNCMQAAIASLLELDLEDVPNFIEFVGKGQWLKTMHGFLNEKGYDAITVGKSKGQGTQWLKDLAKFDNGVNGYLYASVPSRTFENGTHAVIVDTDLRVVHDPNPNQKCLDIKPDEVISIMVMHDMVCGKTGKFFTKEEWNNISEEERSANVYRADSI